LLDSESGVTEVVGELDGGEFVVDFGVELRAETLQELEGGGLLVEAG